jgi:hypothetical protein
MRVAVSLMPQTGQSSAIHSPEACAYNASGLVNRGGLHGRDLMLAQGPAHDVEPAQTAAHVAN